MAYLKVTIINRYKFWHILKLAGWESTNFSDFPKIFA